MIRLKDCGYSDEEAEARADRIFRAGTPEDDHAREQAVRRRMGLPSNPE